MNGKTFTGIKKPERIQLAYIGFSLFFLTTYFVSGINIEELNVSICMILIIVLISASVFTDHLLYRLNYSVFQLICYAIIISKIDNDMMMVLVLTLCIAFGNILHYSNTISLFLNGLLIILQICLTAFDGYSVKKTVSIIVLESGLIWLFYLLIGFRERLVRMKKEKNNLQVSMNNLAAANHSFVEYFVRVEAESEKRERFRITRELHDSIGYSMTSVAMMMNASKLLLKSDPDKLIEYCEKTREISTKTMAETRQILYKLRAINNESRQSLPLFFSQICKNFEKATSVKTEFIAQNLPEHVTEKVFNVLFRTAQVGFINALRHGHAQHIRLYFYLDKNALSMTIWNSGYFHNEKKEIRSGIGLEGIKERLDSLNGTLSTESVADGFELKLTIPRECIYERTN